MDWLFWVFMPWHDGKAVADNCCCVFCVSALAITLVATLPRQSLVLCGSLRYRKGPGAVGAGARLYAHEGEEHFSAGEPGEKPLRVVEITMQER
jgi:hypothetical protein